MYELLEEQQDRSIHRVQYAYHAMAENQFLFRYDRDPDNHPDLPEHKHLPPDRRLPSGPVTFREVLDEMYDVVNEIEG